MEGTCVSGRETQRELVPCLCDSPGEMYTCRVHHPHHRLRQATKNDDGEHNNNDYREIQERLKHNFD